MFVGDLWTEKETGSEVENYMLKALPRDQLLLSQVGLLTGIKKMNELTRYNLKLKCVDLHETCSVV